MDFVWKMRFHLQALGAWSLYCSIYIEPWGSCTSLPQYPAPATASAITATEADSPLSSPALWPSFKPPMAAPGTDVISPAPPSVIDSWLLICSGGTTRCHWPAASCSWGEFCVLLRTCLAHALFWVLVVGSFRPLSLHTGNSVLLILLNYIRGFKCTGSLCCYSNPRSIWSLISSVMLVKKKKSIVKISCVSVRMTILL